MKTIRNLVLLIIALLVIVTPVFLIYQHHQHQAFIKLATDNYKKEQARDRIMAKLESDVDSFLNDQELHFTLELVNMDSPTSQKIYERQQMKIQYVTEWVASKKEAAISSGADKGTIDQMDQSLHEAKAEIIKDASDSISDLEKSNESNDLN